MKNLRCTVCQNTLTYLGRLGDLEWMRCDGCGMEQSEMVSQLEPEGEPTW
jgi:hypothetical protein